MCMEVFPKRWCGVVDVVVCVSICVCEGVGVDSFVVSPYCILAASVVVGVCKVVDRVEGSSIVVGRGCSISIGLSSCWLSSSSAFSPFFACGLAPLAIPPFV